MLNIWCQGRTTLPQEPQFSGSAVVSMHMPPHSVRPGGQTGSMSVSGLKVHQSCSNLLQVAITSTVTLMNVVSGVVVVIDGTSVMLIDVATDTLTVGTVATETITVGVGRSKHPQAVDIREHANGTGAPAQPPAPWVVVVIAFDVVDVVVQTVVGFLAGGGGGGDVAVVQIVVGVGFLTGGGNGI